MTIDERIAVRTVAELGLWNDTAELDLITSTDLTDVEPRWRLSRSASGPTWDGPEPTPDELAELRETFSRLVLARGV